MKDWFMNLLYYLKRPLIWLSRFRYRCGYGVHSPFAFSLITDVIYEKMPYYAYDLLKAEQKKRITTTIASVKIVRFTAAAVTAPYTTRSSRSATVNTAITCDRSAAHCHRTV